jgi:hypothetical protein
MFAVPAMEICVPYPFKLTVNEPVIGYLLKLKDLSSVLLTAQMEELISMFCDEPDDDQVRQMWLDRQEAIQWNAFKKKVLKDARKFVATEKRIANGEWTTRRSGQPKPLKDHRPFTPLVRKLYH